MGCWRSLLRAARSSISTRLWGLTTSRLPPKGYLMAMRLLTSLQTLATGYCLRYLGCAPRKAEEMEATLRSVVKETSWIDWWTYAMKFLSLKSTDDTCLVCILFLAGVRCQLIAKTSSTLWANVVLKRRDTVLAKVKDSITFKSFMDLRNANIFSGTELFPADVLNKAVEKSSQLESSFQRQAGFTREGAPLFRYSSQTAAFSTVALQKAAGSLPGSSFRSTSSTSSSSKASSSSSCRGKGKKF